MPDIDDRLRRERRIVRALGGDDERAQIRHRAVGRHRDEGPLLHAHRRPRLGQRRGEHALGLLLQVAVERGADHEIVVAERDVVRKLIDDPVGEIARAG